MAIPENEQEGHVRTASAAASAECEHDHAEATLCPSCKKASLRRMRVAECPSCAFARSNLKPENVQLLP